MTRSIMLKAILATAITTGMFAFACQSTYGQARQYPDVRAMQQQNMQMQLQYNEMMRRMRAMQNEFQSQMINQWQQDRVTHRIFRQEDRFWQQYMNRYHQNQHMYRQWRR